MNLSHKKHKELLCCLCLFVAKLTNLNAISGLEFGVGHGS